MGGVRRDPGWRVLGGGAAGPHPPVRADRRCLVLAGYHYRPLMGVRELPPLRPPGPVPLHLLHDRHWGGLARQLKLSRDQM